LAAVGGTIEAGDTVMGSGVNLTARLESAAPPGGLLISHETYRNVRGLFDVQPLPAITAKGFDQPVVVYLVLRAKPRSFRSYQRGVEGIETRMVGREAEIKLLQDALRLALDDGEGQLITISGEAGVGKSRLLYEFENWIELLPEAVRYFRGRSRPEAQNQPFALLRDLFAFRFEILDSDPLDLVRQKIQTGFTDVFGNTPAGEMRAHFIGQLLGIDFTSSPYLKGTEGDPQQLRERAGIYLEEYLRGFTLQNPSAIFFEDIHWADDSSLDLIDQIARQTPNLPLIIICLTRPDLFERRPYWGEGLSYHRNLELQPLSKIESRRLVAEILQKVDQIPVALRELVVSWAEGSPFFIEEMIKMLIDQGVVIAGGEQWQVLPERLARVEVPSTLTGVLQARLDSLPQPERLALQLASVMGRVFWDEAVQQMGARLREHEDLNLKSFTSEHLSTLRQRELIYRREASSFSGAHEYSFKHALLRDVAYESIIRQERFGYHELAAEWLAEMSLTSGRADEYAGEIADHYRYAEQTESAASWYIRAGQRAKAQGALKDARAALTHALELLLPGDLERRWQVLLDRDEVLGILGEKEARLEDDQALIGLAEELGDEGRLAEAYFRRGYFLGTLGQYHEAFIILNEKALPAAERAGNRNLEAQVLGLIVVNQTRLGEMQAASETAEKVLGDKNDLDDDTLSRTYFNLAIHYESQDISKAVDLLNRAVDIVSRLHDRNLEASCLANIGYLYTLSGFPEQGVTALKRVMGLAQVLENRRLLAYTRLNLGLAYTRLEDHAHAQTLLNEALLEFDKIGDVFATAACHSYLGLAFEGEGDPATARSHFAEARVAFEKIGVLGYALDAQVGLARCLLGEGKPDQAEALIAGVWDQLSRNGPEGMEFPVRAYLICAEIFRKAGEVAKFQAALREGQDQLLVRADRISDPAWRIAFLEKIPEHRSLIEMWAANSGKDKKGEK
jgi:tetratricopeptide (TPR) repeat protein